MARRAMRMLLLAVAAASCGRKGAGTVAPAVADTARRAAPRPAEGAIPRRDPILPPEQAFLAGMMPLRSTGADTFRLQRPTYDGRGVIIGILDSGVDPGLPGLRTTTTGEPKLLDLRDFSGEGRVELHPLTPAPDGSVNVDGQVLSGFGRVARLAQPPYFGGVLRELPLGRAPAADLNANGTNLDVFPLLVAKSTSGWFVAMDTDGDGSLENESPLYDYSVSGQTFTLAPATRRGPSAMSLAVNLSAPAAGGRPVLDLFFDNSGHGSHVAGIAAGHDMFGLTGFDGVAPGAQLLALKISNNARGGISVTGSMLRAMNYAADFAVQRGLPLVLNMSFGVGNEAEGSAAIDTLVNEFALKHPGILFVISAGNDGPGLSTVGFPGSADRAVSACALFPGVFAQPPDAETPVPPDVMGWWSARGGELAKPDLCAPGVAYSNVPPWHTGEEISGGTSMAAPQVSGLAALLQSALSQSSRPARAVDLKRALIATARPLPGVTALDQGSGIPNVGAAYRWLVGSHQSGIYDVRSLPDGGNQSSASGAYRRNGLESDADTVQRFRITSLSGQPAARLLFTSDAPWLHAPSSVGFAGTPEIVTLTYDAAQLTRPGLHVGTVWGRSATDTLAGPLVALTNTVVVPWPANQPVRARETLPAGRLARYFVPVAEGSGGLTARLTIPADRSSATLYLFEPDGKPQRGGSSAEANEDSTAVTLRVDANDVVPGVYEIAVMAPPNAPARYSLDVNTPPVTIVRAAARDSVAVRNLSASPVNVRASILFDGVARDTQLVGAESRPALLRVETPEWADRLVIDVSFSGRLWNTVTDFGLSVFDREGQLISEGPMNYTFTRQPVKLDQEHRGVPLDIELFPAFARLTPPDSWNAAVRVRFAPAEPLAWPQAESVVATVAPGEEVNVGLPVSPPPAPVPGGYRSLVRVTAAAADAVPAVREVAW